MYKVLGKLAANMGGKKTPIISSRERVRVVGDYYQSDNFEMQTYSVDGMLLRQVSRFDQAMEND